MDDTRWTIVGYGMAVLVLVAFFLGVYAGTRECRAVPSEVHVIMGSETE